MMIAKYGEYVITFTDDDIREAAGKDLTDEQCERIAYEIESIFDDKFAKTVKNAEV